jgi:hypothetical protein
MSLVREATNLFSRMNLLSQVALLSHINLLTQANLMIFSLSFVHEHMDNHDELPVVN